MVIRYLIALPLIITGAFVAKETMQAILVTSGLLVIMSGICSSCGGGSCEIPKKK